MPGSAQSDSLAATVTEVSERVSILVREEIELAKAEMTQKVSSLARGAAAVAAGAVFGIFAVVMGLGTLAWGLNSLIGSLWLGFLITFVILLALTAGAFLFARSKLKVGVPPAPTMAIDEAKKIRETVTSKPAGDQLVAAPPSDQFAMGARTPDGTETVAQTPAANQSAGPSPEAPELAAQGLEGATVPAETPTAVTAAARDAEEGR